MDEDGFYMGELNGMQGLVPSNFLQPAPPSTLLPPHMPPGSLSLPSQQQQPSMDQIGRPKGVAFTEMANKKPLPVRQSSQTSNKMANIVANIGATSTPQMGNSIPKAVKSAGAAPSKPLAKKASDVGSKSSGGGGAPRKTSQAAKKVEGTKVEIILDFSLNYPFRRKAESESTNGRKCSRVT